MKNLDFLLKVLLRVKSTLELFIYGPKEDLDYWKKCLKLINKLPFNIKVTIKEELTYDKVANTFSQFDLFAFPTKGENFGHVIIESLLAGTPVLLSDKTFWRHNYTPNLKIIPLKENDWVKDIEGWANLSKDTIIRIKKNTFKLAKKIKKDLNKKAIIQNRNLFKKIINNY
jgi:glycosyltransferase involved in cell wall biosynthesis